MERLSYLNDHVDKIDDQDEYMTTVGSADMRNMISEFIEDFEEKRIKKKKKKKELNLERTVFDYENSTNN